MKATTSKKRRWQYWRKLLSLTVVALLFGILFTSYGGLPYEYANAIAHPQRASVCCLTPTDLGLAYQNVSFATSDRLILRGWYLPSKNRAAVIIAHGLGSTRAPHLPQAAALARHGYGVLLFDSRAHGESEGNTITFSGKDVLAALTFLRGCDDIDPNKIGALGFSLGGMIVIQAAGSTDNIKSVVADGPGPTGFEDEPTPKSAMDWFMLPFYWTEYQVWKWQGVAAPVPIVEAIANISPRPVLLIAGGQNKAELELQRRFFSAAREPKTLWKISEVGHLGGWEARPKEYEERIVTFFDQALLRDGKTN